MMISLVGDAHSYEQIYVSDLCRTYSSVSICHSQIWFPVQAKKIIPQILQDHQPSLSLSFLRAAPQGSTKIATSPTAQVNFQQ